jgi:hypothetical protein
MRIGQSLWVVSLAVALPATAAQADVVVRGPFGGQIVVTAPPDVVVSPAPVVPVMPPAQPAPQPLVATTGPILPHDFARTFQPRAGTFTVVFLHPRTNQPVTVAFTLPQGSPRVSYVANSLLFDYGQHEVEIRFQILGKVKVLQR